MSGTIVGVVEKEKVINGSRITRGNILLGFKSSGLHTNGYSLARKILFAKYSPSDHIPEINNSIGNELLAIHKSYLNLIRPLAEDDLVTGLSHITGGGIMGNTMRVIPKPLELKINWNAWEVPAIFKFIQKTGSVTDEEMRNVFNMGIGLVAIVPVDKLDKALDVVSNLGETAIIMGEVV
jgi:phosphoribosylformylglycinamidine cyclo-ligase